MDYEGFHRLRIEVEWECAAHKLCEGSFYQLVCASIRSLHGIIMGSLVIELIDFDEDKQRGVLCIFPPAKAKVVKQSLVFLSSEIGRPCVVQMEDV